MTYPESRWLDELAYEDLEDAPEFHGDFVQTFKQVDPLTANLYTAWEVDSLVHRYMRSLCQLDFDVRVRSDGDDGDAKECRAIFKRTKPGRPHVCQRGDIAEFRDVPTDGLNGRNGSHEHPVFVFVAQRLQDGERMFDGAPREAKPVRCQSVVRLETFVRPIELQAKVL